ncbi:ribosome maturation factor RimM [Marinobacter nanhaiticus D15-8W]|uniref:Ribosome maturation factor RimM n=1 Tax=Marinobacter nanhaiticus D15-8W TaxID=626887 RepID=N6X6I3_9GAMM|nr:ribosome maturation factor RimM [Marinobacter nanhaiticus]ENO16703.1 ribosome maturation factor RimM [Marinobacter nanhaiticus D15-8W]BES72505.1 ribosome maturation factor RimM [Marinobacter nanhaiticus D15-8W]
MADNAQETVVGRITSVFGVKGWVKVYSYTDPMEGILDYPHWHISQGGKKVDLEVVEGKRHGPGIVVRLKGVNDRDQARSYCGLDVMVPIESLPELPEGEYYWHQLEGLAVTTPEGDILGVVKHLMETGSNDVIVVRPTPKSIDNRERLIPYLPDQVIQSVDLAAGTIVADWDPEF